MRVGRTQTWQVSKLPCFSCTLGSLGLLLSGVLTAFNAEKVLKDLDDPLKKRASSLRSGGKEELVACTTFHRDIEAGKSERQAGVSGSKLPPWYVLKSCHYEGIDCASFRPAAQVATRMQLLPKGAGEAFDTTA